MEKYAAEQQQSGGGGKKMVVGVGEYKLLQDTELGAFHIARRQRQVTDS